VGKKIEKRVHFFEHDIIKTWPFRKDHFDFAIDCFVSTDVEGVRNRRFMIKEAYRVLKPGGYFLLYTNSTKSEFYKNMVKKYKVNDVNAFCYPDIKKFEKVFSEEELRSLYGQFKLKKSKRYQRNSNVKDNSYLWEHFWRVYQKT
jgi:ubiquinone/menaquinone biosynthesis C-methylase UbiE